jgi:hypothetical protein
MGLETLEFAYAATLFSASITSILQKLMFLYGKVHRPTFQFQFGGKDGDFARCTALRVARTLGTLNQIQYPAVSC